MNNTYNININKQYKNYQYLLILISILIHKIHFENVDLWVI